MLYGGDYNPDQWPEEVWQQDVRLMREAGVNLVSLGIFAWSRLEPKAGTFDFEWLDRIMNLLHEGGLSVDLATATASPPPWLSHAHPEMLPVLADGVQLWPGGRQHYCPSSPVYRDATRRLVDALATRYAQHPALVMWHVGNEYACHVPACFCNVSARAFREWLKQRYGSLGELNRAWGTDFWSQRYSAWEEILPPRRTPTWPNPSQQLDFMRFSSDELLECYEIERRILTERTPGIPVTTNFMRLFKPLDYWKWAEREDIVSDDVYQDPLDPEAGMRAAMAGDLMRSLGRGRPWILMEQSPNRVNWRDVNAPKAPGVMRLWSLQALARGADGVMFFQWRQSRAGAEKFHSAAVPHGPAHSSPTWREVVQLGGELRELDAVCGSRVRADVAILLDWESWWALELPSKPSNRVQQIEQLEAYYRPLFEANVTADFARSTDDLSRYKLVIAPSLYLVNDAAAANVAAHVEGGGNLLMSFFSGIVDANDHIRLGGHPQPFLRVLGMQVLDWLPLGDGEVLPVRFGDGGEGHGVVWSELIEAQGAEVLATFTASSLSGRPAVTLNRFGAGSAQYVGTHLDPAALGRCVRSAWTRAGVMPVSESPAGVEVVRRTMPGGSLLFLLNHGDAAVEISISGDAVYLNGGNTMASGRVHLEPRDVAILHQSEVPSQA
ncbi:MAG: beta-galactosidase [Candidatus Dormibacteraeota bacterium]|nr:beta-galactosidase [Candidatus Dormibacteraeota bacterium]